MGSRRDKIRKFILQEQEEDDELFSVLVPVLYSCLYEEKRPVHTSSLSGAIKDYPNVRKFRSKPFIHSHALASLYEGSVATGDLNFVSIPQVDLKSDVVSPMNSSTNDYGCLNPFSSTNLDGGFSSTNLHGQGAPRRDEFEPATSASSGQKGEEPVRKRKQSQVTVVLEDYIHFRKKQSEKLVEEMKEPKQDENFSIANCVATLEPMEELTVAEKAKALRLFKCQMNREIFINTKNSSVRLYWLKEEIAAMEKT